MPLRSVCDADARTSPPDRTSSARTHLRGVLAAAAVLFLGGNLGGDALAFAPDAPGPTPAPIVRAPADRGVDLVLDRASATEAEEAPGTWMERISRRLRKIPLRPVTIGDAPRTPDDPEPGAGLTIFLQF